MVQIIKSVKNNCNLLVDINNVVNKMIEKDQVQ